MGIPLQAQVECTDGICGLSVCVLIDSVSDQVVHVVVKETITNMEYIVPVDVISAIIADTIRLSFSKTELEKMPLFTQTEFVQEKVLDYAGYMGGTSGMGQYFYVPRVTSEVRVPFSTEHKQIPPGEMAIHRGTRIEATDDYVGKVDEFVVNPENGHITYLVMREGHLWGDKNVIIPVSAMEDNGDDTVFLNIDKHQIESLPTFAVKRRWA